ncbi:EAL domain-containing protein [Rhodoferax sp. AJA081-3]|uniref:putative bifunctional diguanylate cyclase/phosphodiesterase n=1 Tax=Rhodoferax sp. AJA081-3 TaxID=2752316 RepID=UPI001AE02874|nr:EAL domain-containing protein [Rhodoferax sp. AJA081-3]QTN30380.1 EAL domain-containing protein [Rhodoferax sp. AJA081-3]
MPNTTDPSLDTAHALRTLRMAQISVMVAVALAVALPFFVYQARWQTVYPLLGGLTVAIICFVLNRRGHTARATLLLLTSITAMSWMLMWWGDGLKDAALLAFPVLLIMAGLLVGKRGYYLLWASMIGLLAVQTWATTKGWRASPTLPRDPVELWRDVSLILAVGGLAVWTVVNDMHKTLLNLREQVVKVTASQKQLAYLSQHDALTGLPNRAMGRDHIQQAITNATRRQSRVALLFVDLDNFKAVNDSLGHAMGDEFLKQVATRLAASVRKSDIVARQGGDEFVIGLTDILSVDDVSKAASTVQASLGHSIFLGDTELSAACSIGIALFPDDGADYESLLREADIAMYQAKEAGRNTCRFFDPAMNANIQSNLLLLSNLRAALVRSEFVLHYQPVVDLTTGELVGAEALVRWQHTPHTLVPPGDFIPAAEKSGLIVELGEWVLREACRQMVAWQAAGREHFVMAVNLSPVQFRRGNIETVVAAALQQSGLNPACLELEITESTLVQDTETFIASLQHLKALGVKISIDDFGTGYSNLSYLQRFAVDKLKIDQSFVKRLLMGPQDRAIVTAIIQMAKSLNLSTTAEGIEDDATRQILLDLGCVQGQGYFFARPVPVAAFEQTVRALAQEKARTA